jgi:FtsP/CotA-like multicopper oxidase with cupredoxin domain
MRAAGLGRHALAVAAGLAVLVAACGSPSHHPIGPTGGENSPAAGGTIRQYDLTAAATTVELRPGLKVQAWTYNGTTPGPELTGVVGDLLRVRLHNRLPAGTTIHWHGLDVANGEDGVAGITQDAVPPGAEATYSFRLTQAGTYWYHSHQDSAAQLDRGLYGALVVLPREPPAAPAGIDRTLVYDDWPLGLEAATTPQPADPAMRSYVTTTVNGRTGDAVTPIRVTPGEQVRLRLVNASYSTRDVELPIPVTVAALDGHELSGGPPITDAIPLGPGERVDVTFVAPGQPFTIRLVDGFPPDRDAAVPVTPSAATGPALPEPAAHHLLDLLAYPAVAADDPWPDGTVPNRTFTMTLSESHGMGPMPGMAAVDGVHYLLDGAVFPNTPTLHVVEGDRVEITFANQGTLEHFMHLHGHFFRVLARDGTPLPGRIVKDTVRVPPGHSVTIAFMADNPGVWMIHCHQLLHSAGGMMALLAYAGAPRLAELGGAYGNEPD